MPPTENNPESPQRFLDIAAPLAERGFKVIPLEGKRPWMESWQNSCSNDLEVLKKWDEKWPDANCGVVTQNQPYWVLDVDHLDWFMDHVPEPPKTYWVRTGSGKLHIYFKGERPPGLRNITNPRFRSKKETPNEPAKLLEFPNQVVGEGSLHPDTKRRYEVQADHPLAECPAKFLNWLRSLSSADKTPPEQLRPRALRACLTLEQVLDGTELKGNYERFDRGDRIFLNYHSRLGRCLLKGGPHHGNGGVEKNRQCGFYYMKANPADWGHQCFSCGPGRRNEALRALGVEPQDVLAPAWRDMFRTKNQLSSEPLEFLVENLIPEEGVTGLAGWSGHGKTWVMLSIAKAVSSGSALWGQFKTKKSPVLYLIPESGDRALKHRMDQMCIPNTEDFLVRTLTQGSAPKLRDPHIQEAATGRLVVMDTFPRWLDGRDEQNSSAMAELNEEMNALIRAGARAVLFAQHSTKQFEKSTMMSGADAFRGSGDIYANMSAGHVVVQLDDDRSRTLLHLECVKPRDFEPLGPFQLEGKPWIEKEGDFRLVKHPGECGRLQEEKARVQKDAGARPILSAAEWERVEPLILQGKSVREIEKATGINRNRINRHIKREPMPEGNADGLHQGDF